MFQQINQVFSLIQCSTKSLQAENVEQLIQERAEVAKWNITVYVPLSAGLETLLQFKRRVVLQHKLIQQPNAIYKAMKKKKSSHNILRTLSLLLQRLI